MPFYRVTVRTKKKRITGIRELSNPDIDYAWRYYEKKILQEYRGTDLVSYEIVMVSKLSEDVKRYLKKPKRPLRNE